MEQAGSVNIDFKERFGQLQERYRKPDGAKWRNKDIEEATGGFVTGNYVSNLKRGLYKNPGHDRLLAIADIMGFPAELWYFPPGKEPVLSELEDAETPAQQGVGSSLAQKLEFLMGSRVDPATGDPLSDQSVSRLTGGEVTEDELRAARTGELTQLHAAQYHALSLLFGVDPGFWYRSHGRLPPVGTETVESLRDWEAEEVLNKFHALKRPQDRSLIRSLLDRFSARDE